jgi:hypothetical protein
MYCRIRQSHQEGLRATSMSLRHKAGYEINVHTISYRDKSWWLAFEDTWRAVPACPIFTIGLSTRWSTVGGRYTEPSWLEIPQIDATLSA